MAVASGTVEGAAVGEEVGFGSVGVRVRVTLAEGVFDRVRVAVRLAVGGTVAVGVSVASTTAVSVGVGVSSS